MRDESVVSRNATSLGGYQRSEPRIDARECGPWNYPLHQVVAKVAVAPGRTRLADCSEPAGATDRNGSQNGIGDHGAGSQYMAADSSATAPGRTSVTWPAAAMPPSLVSPR